MKIMNASAPRQPHTGISKEVLRKNYSLVSSLAVQRGTTLEFYGTGVRLRVVPLRALLAARSTTLCRNK
jgi:hypothetical protein